MSEHKPAKIALLKFLFGCRESRLEFHFLSYDGPLPSGHLELAMDVRSQGVRRPMTYWEENSRL